MISNSVFESCVQNLGFYSVKLRVPLRVALRSVALRFVLRCFALRVGLRVALRCVALRVAPETFTPKAIKLDPGGAPGGARRPEMNPRRSQETQHRPRRAKTKPQEAPGGQK